MEHPLDPAECSDWLIEPVGMRRRGSVVVISTIPKDGALIAQMVVSVPRYLYQMRLGVLCNPYAAQILQSVNDPCSCIECVLYVDKQLGDLSNDVSSLEGLSCDFLDYVVYGVHKLHGEQGKAVLEQLKSVARVTAQDLPQMLASDPGCPTNSPHQRFPHLLSDIRSRTHQILLANRELLKKTPSTEQTKQGNRKRVRIVRRNTNFSLCQQTTDVNPPFSTPTPNDESGTTMKAACTSAGESQEALRLVRQARKSEVVDAADQPLLKKQSTSSMTPSSSSDPRHLVAGSRQQPMLFDLEQLQEALASKYQMLKPFIPITFLGVKQ